MKSKITSNGSEGESWSHLDSLEKEIRKEIGAFQVSKVSQAARWLERSDDLQKRHGVLRNELSDRLREGRLLLNPIATVSDQRPGLTAEADGSDSANIGAKGGKARGRECRAAYVTQQAENGKPFTRVRGALYRNGNGVIVGIAYAMASKNAWFLGLPAGAFKEAILLCEAMGNKIQPIHLPESFIEKYGRRLPVSTQYNQAKFNVQYRAGRYYLSLKGSGDEDLTDYVAGQPFICPRTEYL